MRKIRIYVCLGLTLLLLLSTLTSALAVRGYDKPHPLTRGAAGGFPGQGNGVVTEDPAGEPVSVFPGKGCGVSSIGADGTIIFVFPGKTNADGTIRPIYRQKCFTSHF